MVFTLTGFMGCGKSSVGKALAAGCGWEFVDTDKAVEESTGMSVSRIFSEYGEAAFRDMEYRCLSRIVSEAQGRNVVVALGGGTVTDPRSRKLVMEKTFCIYLRCPVEELVSNLIEDGMSGRPLLEGCTDLRARVEELMSQRESLYSGCSKMTRHPYSLSSDDLLACLDVDDA